MSLLPEMTKQTLRTLSAAFKYIGSSWVTQVAKLSYKEDKRNLSSCILCPNYKWEAGELVLKEGKVAGTDEYIEGKANITLLVKYNRKFFRSRSRNYSRLRIATGPNMQNNS